ncbi:UPF0481 protein [Acorus calamus]|uniref:UPF0481 protein n=1 Tax=Acorus calamus TaxID=4465 RepID=A0AAV9FAL2_ACOCL|nr:UPF0481 protein [Acorus calamus]
MATQEQYNPDETFISSLKNKLSTSFVPRWREEPCSIFRVPPILRMQNPEVYEPRIFPIGPYHRTGINPMPMEKRKHCMARRLFSKHPDTMMDRCVKEVMALEKRARSCYADEIDLESNEFVEMMILDGCFIIGVLMLERSNVIRMKRRIRGEETSAEGEERNWSGNWVWWEQEDEEPEKGATHNLWPLLSHLHADLLKVENQIPFFIVETLYNLLVTQDDDGEDVSIFDLAISFINNNHSHLLRRYVNILNPQIHHLLHLFYVMLLPGPKISPTGHSLLVKLKKKIRQLLRMPCCTLPSFLKNSEAAEWRRRQHDSGWLKSVTELQEVGIKFVVVKNDRCSFMDVTFKNGVMEIPTLCIFESTMPLFRNLIAFEQCYPFTRNHVTFYAVLMQFLLDTPKDVKVLQGERILRSRLNDEEVACLFNRLCRDIIYSNSNSYLTDVFHDVNGYCDSRWHRWRAVLARDYFSNPWTVISLVAAVVLLILTFLQTYYSMYGYYHPH